MKKLFVIALLLSATTSINAQTWDEWFRQKATQKKYLLQQIAALQMYSDYLITGYNITSKGLHAIQDIKNGDFNLHSDYFNSFLSVSPKIKRYARVAQIISLQINISDQIIKVLKDCQKSDQLTITEISYLKSVFKKVLNDCKTIIDQVGQTLSDNQLSMKDDERISAIEILYKEMLDNQVFTQVFCNSANVLCAERKQEKSEVLIEQKLNGSK